jgi:hypothetical protein
MTDEGYQPGRDLTSQQRTIALAAWLKDQESLPVLKDKPLEHVPQDFFETNDSSIQDQESNGSVKTVGSR